MAELTPEALDWLRRAAALRLTREQAAPGDPPSWAEVASAARWHNLEPLLFELHDRGELAVPGEVAKTWEGQYFRNQIFNHALFETMTALTADTDSGRMEIVVLKGPVAVARLWRDLGLRVMVDLDLLCHQKDLAELAERARAHGFDAVGENATYHLSFASNALGAGLELHFDLYDVLANRTEFVRHAFETSSWLEVDGFRFRGPSAAAEAVIELAHLLQHDYAVDLRHWLDFSLAIEEAGREPAELAELLELVDLKPEFDEASAVAAAVFEPADSGSGNEDPALAAVEAALLDRRDARPLLSGARVQSGWWQRSAYVARILVPSPGRWRALAVSEGTSVGRALGRHVARALGRGRGKLATRGESTAPESTPRARLFARRSAQSARA